MLDTNSYFHSVPRIIFGVGALNILGDEAKKIGATKVAIITDPGIVNAKIHEPAIAALEKAGLSWYLFGEVVPEPSVQVVAEATKKIKEAQSDLIVGLGGGSALDIAKAVAVQCCNAEPIEKYAGVNLVPNPGLPTILIPTTAGTGSEATSISVLSDDKDNFKKGVVSDYMFAKVVLLDPEMTMGLPPGLTASTGLDTLVHAMESFVGKRATFITRPLALSAMELVGKYLRRAYANGNDIEARGGMLKASLLAGMAFGNTQTGAAHALGHSLGAVCKLPHGISTAVVLPAIMKFNSIAAREKYAEIAQALGESVEGLTLSEAAEKAIDAVNDLIADVDMKMGLENYGVSVDDIPELTEGSITPAQRLWNNNPRSATYAQVEELFKQSFGS